MILASLPASAASASGTAELPFRFYSVADGLTQSEVYDIEQDRAGYLWFSTQRGLNRFDGREFEHLTIADGLPTNNLMEVQVDRDNTIWVGDARGGISLVRGGRVVSTIAPIGERSTPILDIEIEDARTLVIAEGLGLLSVTQGDDGFVMQPIGGQDIGARDIVIDSDVVWIAADTGLYQLVRGGSEIVLVDTGIRQVHVDNETAWVVDAANRLGRWVGGEMVIDAETQASSPINSIVTDASGSVWMSSDTELFSYDGGESTGDVVATALRRHDAFDNVSTMFFDREDTLWMSSNSRLIRFLGDRFQHFKLQTGADPQTVWAITADADGRMWFGTQTGLIRRNVDETLTAFGEEHGLPPGSLRDLVTGESGQLWIGIRGEGFFEFDLATERARLVEGTEGFEVLDVELAGDGVVWFSTAARGIFRYAPQDGRLENYATPKNGAVYTLDVSEDGSLWYGADEVALVHLTRLSETEFRQQLYDRNHGLHHDLFNHIQVTGDGEAWIAAEEGGLYQLKGGRFVSYNPPDAPYADQTVYIVQPLPNGSIVVGGEQGLYQFVPGADRTVHYNQLDGFVGLETNVHATYVDVENGLWIGTVDGASRMDMTMSMPEQVDVMPQILRMETALDNLEISEGAEIPPGQRGALIEFGAVSLKSPRSVEYSYKLDGADSDWGAPTTNRTVSYSGISPGDYRFMVRARYPGGDWSLQPVTRSFSVMPFFWQRPAVILTALLLMALVIRAGLGYRTRKIRRLNDKLKAEVAERTRSIESAKEKLQQSNEQLSLEIEERQKADQARAEIEARFRRAFENAPIGMGLLDIDGVLFDANPALLNMFWPKMGTLPNVRFADLIDESDREEFISLYQKLMDGRLESIDEKLCCVDADEKLLNTEVNLSAVRSDDGEFLYSVLQVQDVTESLKLTDQLEYQAMYDELTGLLNRRAFEAELTRAWEHGRGSGALSFLMYMDLDQFKVVNDTSGHAAGDTLLKQVSEMLIDSVRANDTVGRLGGDEFAIILWKCPVDVAHRIAESIRASIEAYRFQWDKETYRIGVSIGGVPVDPNAGDTNELAQLADAACYAAKEAGRNRVHMVAGGEDSARAHRGQVRWVQRLREAMDNNRFAIYGQTMKPLDESIVEPERLEILLRLRDPKTRKLIPPGAFLPAAERYGLSLELDEWVVRSLLNALFVYQSFSAEHRRYWINLSGTSIGDKRFAGFLREMIQNSPLPPGTINFEITETAVIRNVAEAGKLMAELREMGCQFALDDFGSGLSSFGYLKKLPIDYLKIDGMFIRDIHKDETDRIFVKSIIDIGHTLNIKTICEFVENEEMLEIVRELGADYAQGFAIGRPYVLAPRFPGSDESLSKPIELQQAG